MVVASTFTLIELVHDRAGTSSYYLIPDIELTEELREQLERAESAGVDGQILNQIVCDWEHCLTGSCFTEGDVSRRVVLRVPS
jgi:hypothetical protein